MDPEPIPQAGLNPLSEQAEAIYQRANGFLMVSDAAFLCAWHLATDPAHPRPAVTILNGSAMCGECFVRNW
jgi:hypothetical protein